MSDPRRKRFLLALPPAAAVLGLAAACLAADKPPAADSPQVEWGKAVVGLQTSLSMPESITVGGPFGCRLALRNTRDVPFNLPPAAAPGGREVFGWLFIVQQTADAKRAWYTEKIPLARDLPSWPEKLVAGKTVQMTDDDLADRTVHEYKRGLKVVAGYPTGGSEEKATPQRLRQGLAPGAAQARMMLYLPLLREPPVLIVSNTVRLEVRLPDFLTLPPAERKAAVAKLLARFDRDAWAAQQAHHDAVQIGPPIVGDLVAALADRKRPFYSRLWLATALTDIRDPKAVAALIGLLDEGGGVRSVVAYHGPKQHDAGLDEAIAAKIAASGDAGAMSYALLGFLVFRGTVPEGLLAASFESTDPRVRATLAAALKNHASDFNVSRLVALLKDADERVRSAAAKALGPMGQGGKPVIAALVAALARPGDHARQSVAEALEQLTGRKAPYDPKAGADAKSKVAKDWQDWWAESNRK